MNLKFPEGKSSVFKDGKEAVDYLSSFRTETIETEPDRLKIIHYQNHLYLELYDGKIHQFPIRESFFMKLLKWFSFPIRQLDLLDNETITSICNDYLLNIKSSKVFIKLEDSEALTITSSKFSEVLDIDLINKVIPLGINKLFIDDYNTNILVEEKCKIVPFPNDVFGFGLSIMNSETGFSAIHLNDFLFRYICSNGAYIKEPGHENKFYHYNLFVPDVFKRLEELINNINYRAKIIETKLRGMASPIKKSEIFSINKEIFRNTAIRLLNDVIDSDTQITKYDLMNLITERAKELPFGLRTKIETIAGNLINLNN